MKIINSLKYINEIYQNNTFNFSQWEKYIDKVIPQCKQTILNDMTQVIKTGEFTFEKDFLPILNDLALKKESLTQLINSFEESTKDIENKIFSKFGNNLNVTIVLYLGLCNGAGWVVTIDGETYVLLGVEKIIELNWCDTKSMIGLIYHELGHVYHEQYGLFGCEFDSSKNNFLWQLFVEGIAMYFEQVLVGDFEFFHQDKNGWKEWCDCNILNIKKDFYNDLNDMTFENQRYFGDWVYYNGHNDIGYYLGVRFIQYVTTKFQFDEIIYFDINMIEKLYLSYLEM